MCFPLVPCTNAPCWRCRAVKPEGEDIQALLEAEKAGLAEQARVLKPKLNTNQRYLRGLFSGGTLCYEAQVIWKEILATPVYSNAPLPGGLALPDSTKSCQHSAVDLGEEEFTVGRPHPMIDNDLRIRRLLQEARDPEVAVILLDVVIGYGAHPDPAAELAPAIQQARQLAGARIAGRGLRHRHRTRSTAVKCANSCSWSAAGAIVCASNAAAARLTGLLVADRTEG